MNNNSKIAIGGDHAGVELKEQIVKFLKEKGFDVRDFGPFSTDSVDYPDFAHPIAESIAKKEFDLGVLICGSANGVCITANKHAGVRAALAWRPDVAALARQHNNANILCLPARFLSVDEAKQITESYLNADFEGGRHANRVSKIDLQDNS